MALPTAKRPRRVLVYADSVTFSGAEALMCELVAGVAAEPELELSVAAPRSNPALSGALARAVGADPVYDVPSQPIPVGALHLLDPRRLAAVERVVRAARPDAMLVNLPSAEYGATPGFVPSARRLPMVGLLHVAGRMGELGFRLGRARQVVARRALAPFGAVFVLSEETAAGFPRLWGGPADRARVIRLPRPELELGDPSEARRRLGLPRQGPVIGMAGRVSFTQKGQDTFLEAARALGARMPEVSFAVAGEGRDEGRLRQLAAESGLGERFRMLGQVSPISDFLSAIDLIAMPSRFEGLPLIALEALEAGRPGVASSVDGLRDVWPSEWRVPPSDPAALAASLERLLLAPREVRAQMVEQGRGMMADRVGDTAPLDVARVLRSIDA